MSAMVILASLTGCAGSSFSLPELVGRRGRDHAERLARYGPTPEDRVTELRSLSKRASEMTATQQQAIAEQLVKRLREEPDPILRCELVRTLAGLQAPAAVAGLHVAMHDEQSQVRIAACQAWPHVGGSEAVGTLITALEGDADVDVRLAAAKALGAFEDPAAIRSLVRLLDQPDPAVQRRAMLSLRQATGEDLGSDKLTWQRLASRKYGAEAPTTLADRPPPGQRTSSHLK